MGRDEIAMSVFIGVGADPSDVTPVTTAQYAELNGVRGAPAILRAQQLFTAYPFRLADGLTMSVRSGEACARWPGPRRPRTAAPQSASPKSSGRSR